MGARNIMNMKKKSLLILLIAAVLLLSGCSSLVKRDSAVDAKQTILIVNGEHVNKENFLNLYNYNLYNEQYYAQMMAQMGFSDGSIDTKTILQNTLQSLITSTVTKQKALELGLDQFTDAENAELDAEAEKQYAEQLNTIKASAFSGSEPTEDELRTYARNQGITPEMVRVSVETNKILERLRASVTDGLTVDDAALQSALDSKVSEEKTKYENGANVYNNVVNAGTAHYYTPAGYRVIRVIETAGDSAQADMEALTTRLAAGEAFDQLGSEIKEYTVREGSTVPNADLVTAALALAEKGDVTEAVQTANGYAVAQYADDTAERTASLEEARATLYDETLKNAQTEAYNAAVQDWIGASKIETFPDRLN